ncbi:MAG: phosphate butyryltransferase [Bacillaceae bacterium]|nr:phosphate butyryltransferase [Bacillaceae bacterium]
MELKNLLEKLLSQNSRKKVAVAQAADAEALRAVQNATEHRLATFILFGNEDEIFQKAEEIQLDLSLNDIVIIHTDPSEAAKKAVQFVHDGKADVLMKGNISTKALLKEVLNKEYGLRTGKIFSHVAVFELPNYHKFLFLTDAAMNIEPNLEEKVQIVQNAVEVAHSIDLEMPKVAPLTAIEAVNPNMQITVDAAALTQMQKRGQLTGCIIDGPLAFDNAISKVAKERKGIESEVAGDADILVVPSLEVGNTLYKSFVYFGNGKVAGILKGASAPIVLTSRADSAETKLYSIVLGLLASN